jgi:predicted AAA+ superfamily ATPase
MQRYLKTKIIEDLAKKMVFLTGPRQVGKTYLSKEIMKSFTRPVYLNFDDISDALIIKKREWPISADLVVLDEIHKMKNWKLFLKGTFDTKPETQSLLITGSARLDTFRQTGESLAGRYFHYRLHPLTLKEVYTNEKNPNLLIERLLDRGGFPEPFLTEDHTDVERWRNQYYADLVREDVLDFSRIHEVRAIRSLLELLRSRVASPLSYRSLAEDLQIAPNTVKKYVAILESLYIIFLIYPFHKNIARAITREPKVYFYDCGYVKGDSGVRFENMIAGSLLKHIQYRRDVCGRHEELYYLRTKEGKELDFFVADDENVHWGLEAKVTDESVSHNIKYFKERYPELSYIQVVENMRQRKEIDSVMILPAAEWLRSLDA